MHNYTLTGTHHCSLHSVSHNCRVCYTYLTIISAQLTLHSTAFHKPPMHITSTRHSWQKWQMHKMYRDVVSFPSGLAGLCGFHPYMHLFSVRKLFFYFKKTHMLSYIQIGCVEWLPWLQTIAREMVIVRGS